MRMTGKTARDTGNQGNIAWIDVETSDLNPWRGARLLEIACVVTDGDLNILDEDGYSAVVKYTLGDTRLMMQKANPFVREMHEKTGLWAAASQRGAKSITTIDKELARYLAQFNANRSRLPLAGNSVRLDLNVVEAFLPMTYQQLDYRVIDVSSVREIADRWYATPHYEKDPAGWHTADADIRESIKELRYYREHVFRAVSETRPDRGTIEAWARGIGMSDEPEKYHSSIHSWRCEYPDRYGRCECFKEFLDGLMNLIEGKK